MAQPEFTSFPALIGQVAALCAQRQTGTVMLVSDDNRMGQIHLRDGEIFFVLCRGRRGREGLGNMRTMQAARLTFAANTVGSGDGIDWPTRTVLDYLSGALDELPGAGAAASAPAPAQRPAGAAAAPAAKAPSAALSADVKASIEKIMLQYIGPMAEIVCADHFASSPDLRALTHALAGEIPGQAQASRFKAEMAKQFNLSDLG